MDIEIFKDHLKSYLDSETINKLIASFYEESNHSLIIDKHKFSYEKLTKYFKTLTKHPFIDDIYYFNKNIDECGKSFLFDNGAYYIIDASSLLISHLLKVEDNTNILDLCSAPGGKSISITLKNRYKNLNIIANDLSFSRIKEMEKNIERLGLSNIILVNNDFEKVYKYYLNTFDYIILDAPCSGSGMFRKNNLVKEDWSIKKVNHFSSIQSKLINIAYKMLKEGGTLVYSTCSYSYEENEKIILDFLKDHSNMELINLPHIQGEYRSSILKGAIHLFPFLYKGEGFFLSFLKKKGDLKLNKKPAKVQYLFKIPITNQVKVKNKLYYNNNFLNLNKLNVIKYGLEVKTFLKENEFIPSFHYAHFCSSKESIPLLEKEKDLYIHGDTFFKDTTKEGFQIVSYDDLNLGYVKIVNKEFKNHYPKGLRH